jgi:hypothetical protein
LLYLLAVALHKALAVNQAFLFAVEASIDHMVHVRIPYF